MKVIIPADEAARFAEQLQTSKYREDERDYKLAVHKVLAALFSERTINDEYAATLIAELFDTATPDLDRLGVAPADQDFVHQTVGAPGVRAAMANLAGGRWGVAQFAWIPRAVEFGFGEPVAEAFRHLVDDAAPVAERVDTFRDALYNVCLALEQKGGFLPGWRLFRVSLSFVAMLLGGYDPTRYTFYSSGALRHGYERYSPDARWPSGSRGEVYAEVCTFVQAVSDALRAYGVPIEDLIDAQSFIWISFSATKKAKPTPTSKPAARVASVADPDAVATDLAARTLWPIDRARHLVGLASSGRPLLFQGPPGTGKTFVAVELARLLSGDEEGRFEVVQFHPSYAYEDFIEGIRPLVTEGSTLAYEIRSGIFLKLVDLARQHPDDPFFMVIDELNRANLPRVFGELLYALEYRGPEHTFRLPYSNAETYIPDNITLIGTMNTADRSIALVDAAIRRRFRHVNFAPDREVLRNWLRANNLGQLADDAAARMDHLNHELLKSLDADRLIGHTYFMRADLAESGYDAVWDEDIGPVLNEHLYNRPEEVRRLRDVFLES